MAAQSQDRVSHFLKSCQTQSGNLHHHLCQMLTNIQDTKLNGVVHFSRISDYFKRVRLQTQIPQLESLVEKKLNKSIQYPKWVCEEERAFSEVKKISNNKDKLYQNFQRVSQSLLQPVGVSFGEEDSFRINCAMKLIGQKENAESIRFWGKIMTTKADYYVIQGVFKKKKQAKVEGSTEKYRQGVNYYSFWVCSNIISDDWYELPLISPDQLVASRLIKYAFTGNLECEVKGYPKFPGKEKHLLKSQLVRITHNCEIVPNGLYTSGGEEENADIDFSEEFKMPEFNDLTNLENWVHLNPHILNLGRADYYKDPSMEQQQYDELVGKLQETDPKVARLRQINEDKPVEKFGMETCWVSKQVGNMQAFNGVGKDEGSTLCYGHAVLKNPHWPGWVTVANSKSFASIYIGYGNKLTQDAFHPLSPEDLDVQGQDIDQFDEPNPRDPPDELEPDSDDENKKPDDA